jgi:hypothetical protein
MCSIKYLTRKRIVSPPKEKGGHNPTGGEALVMAEEQEGMPQTQHCILQSVAEIAEKNTMKSR